MRRSITNESADERDDAPRIALPRDTQFWETSNPRQARRRLLDALRFELLGPELPDEVLRESPLTRYVTGMLAPFGTEISEDERDDELTVSGHTEESGSVDFGAPMSQGITPSSIGLSFLVPAPTTKLVARVSWGDYHAEEVPEENEEISEASDEDLDDDEEKNADEVQRLDMEEETANPREEDQTPKRRRPRLCWVRTPKEPEPCVIQLNPGSGLQRVLVLQDDGVTVEHLCRRIGDQLAVSVFLVNRRSKSKRSRPPVHHWVFQPTLSVQSESGGPAVVPRALEPGLAHSDRDRESNRLLFRKRREFAIGHGCAAEWSEADAQQRVQTVRTQLIPQFEVPRVDPRPLSGPRLDMKTLADVTTGAELRSVITPLLDEYASWIKDQQRDLAGLSPDLQDVGRSHIDDCLSALKRMQQGAALLIEDNQALKAFQFANRAMLLQRSYTIWAGQRRRDPITAPASPTLDGSWRPFQIAFILLNLRALIDPLSEDRRVGDLLWFPTGGGKTEAYLGLAAFTMALRRQRVLAGMRTDAGMAVFMRYTLRLLTIQQFQRAATLLCACEYLRRADSPTWGEHRFSIGLWLGMDGTPNNHDESRRALARIQQDPSEEGANPCQLESCPWCGEALEPNDYWTDGEALRTRVACPRGACDFSKSNSEIGLPVLVVDEEIYRECPSMLIATVDKFAQMPWNGEVQSLFGFVTRECDRCGFLTPASDHSNAHRVSGTTSPALMVRETERLAPPDLIIQDELHLISGPLGTLVALYETAVDFLSTREQSRTRIGPKIVASTATVRRAFEQVQAVFERDLRIFPPPGLEPGDSFFALETPVSEEAPGRLFAGVCAPGKSMKTVYVRVAASLLSSSAGLRRNPTLAEPYTTLVSYFNSLRELGGAIRLIDDDIPARLEQLKTAGFPRRSRPVYVELTSRIRQEAIPHLLRRLEWRHDSPRTNEDPLPLDAVLASNMISVGVDIDRLGLMTVTGQPKTTAEYIQATSRVGRQAWGPGLVVTLYNWSRPRDLSHYERFTHYHRTLYRNVEAVSATPFSSRALDRGLRGVYVAMTRLGSDDLSHETGASQFDPHASRVGKIIDAFRRRAEVVADAETAAALVDSLRGLGDEWWAYRQNQLRYGWRSPNPAHVPSEDVLLRVPEGGRIGHWPAPQSLREVEQRSLVRVFGIDAK